MSDNIQIRLKKTHVKIAGMIALVLAVLVVGTAIAAYLGPNRTTTTCTTNCTAGECSYVGSMSIGANNYFCTLKLAAPNAGSCIPAGSTTGFYQNPTCGWPNPTSTWGTVSASFQGWTCTNNATTCTTTSLAEATTSNSTSCTSSGSNGWCVGTATLNISSTEPLGGYAITGIEGEMDLSSTFFCAGSTCAVPAPEGSHDFDFWALSDYGDSSLKGNATVKVDTVIPTLGTGISGTLGSNGWYITNADVSGSTSDATSGLSTLQVQADGGGYGGYSGPVTLADGSHTVDFIATDNAGLTNSVSFNVNVDTTIPTISLSNPGTVTATVTLSGTYADAASGVASVEVNPAGTGWVSAGLSGGNWSATWDSSSVSNGSYTIQARATDTAGWVSTTASVNFTVDNTFPYVNLPGSWYIWDSASIVVKQGALPIQGATITISDPQGRWADRTYNYSNTYASGFTWDRKFGDGTTAPIGDYIVKVEAWDTLGQTTIMFGTIVIPAPVSNLPPDAPSVAPPSEPVPGSSDSNTPLVLNDVGGSSGEGVGSGATVPDPKELQATLETTTTSQVYWGPAAVALASAATTYVLASKKKREEEEERKRAQAARKRQIVFARSRQRSLSRASEKTLRKEFMAGGGRANAPIEEIQRVLQNAHVAAVVRSQQKLIDEQKQVFVAQQRQHRKMQNFAQAEAEYDYYWTLRREAEQQAARARIQGAMDDAAYEEAVRSGEIDEGEEFRTQMRIKENREKMQGAFDDWGYEEKVHSGEIDEGAVFRRQIEIKALRERMQGAFDDMAYDQAVEFGEIREIDEFYKKPLLVGMRDLYTSFLIAGAQTAWKDGITKDWYMDSMILANQKSPQNAQTLIKIAEGFNKSTTTIRLLYDNSLVAWDESKQKTKQYWRVAWGTEEPPAGMTRWEAVGELVFGLVNVISLGAVGDIRHGWKNGEWWRVGLGLLGMVPFFGLLRAGRAGLAGIRAGGRVLVSQGLRGGLKKAVVSGWDEAAMFVSRARAASLGKIYNVVKSQKAAAVISGTITHADEVADFGFSAYEVIDGIRNESMGQITMGLIFGALGVAGGVATNPLIRPGFTKGEVGRILQGGALKNATKEVKQLIARRGDEALGVIVKHGDEAMKLITKHGDGVLDFLIQHTDEGLDVLQRHGNEVFDLVEAHGKKIVSVLAKNAELDTDLVRRISQEVLETGGKFDQNLAGRMAKVIKDSPELGQKILKDHGLEGLRLGELFGQDGMRLMDGFDDGISALQKHGRVAMQAGEHLDAEAVSFLAKFDEPILNYHVIDEIQDLGYNLDDVTLEVYQKIKKELFDNFLMTDFGVDFLNSNKMFIGRGEPDIIDLVKNLDVIDPDGFAFWGYKPYRAILNEVILEYAIENNKTMTLITNIFDIDHISTVIIDEVHFISNKFPDFNIDIDIQSKMNLDEIDLEEAFS